MLEAAPPGDLGLFFSDLSYVYPPPGAMEEERRKETWFLVVLNGGLLSDLEVLLMFVFNVFFQNKKGPHFKDICLLSAVFRS